MVQGKRFKKQRELGVRGEERERGIRPFCRTRGAKGVGALSERGEELFGKTCVPKKGAWHKGWTIQRDPTLFW